ncbi:MAG TPA: alpha/beta hydrolase [Thermoleophilaceae bacterium]
MTDRQTVLLLHGQPGTGGDWAGVARELGDRFTVLAPDRPGYGSNATAAGGFEHNARAMEALLDEAGAERAVVAGHSWGAGVALAMAKRRPERLRALVLVCPVTPGEQLGRLDRILAGNRAGPLLAHLAFLGAGAALARPALRRRIETLVPGSDTSRWPELARAWRSFWVEQRALIDDLPTLRGELATPTTVIVGGRDHVTDPRAARRYAHEVGARVVEVADAGHLLPMQRPAEVARAITGASSGAR